MKEYRRKHFKLKWILVLLLLLVAIAFVTNWYVNAKVVESVSLSKDSLSSGLTGLNKSISKEELSLDDKISSVSKYTTELVAIKSNLCNTDKDDPLSKIIKLTDTCAAQQSSLDKIINTSDLLLRLLRDDNKLVKILNESSATDSFHDQALLWANISKGYNEYNVVDVIKDEKQSITDIIGRYATAWKALDDADNAQDGDAFNLARQEVYDTHAQLIKNDKIFQEQTSRAIILLNNQIQAFNS